MVGPVLQRPPPLLGRRIQQRDTDASPDCWAAAGIASLSALVTGAGAGAVAGAVLSGGSAIGPVGGAAVGGIIGNEVGKDKK